MHFDCRRVQQEEFGYLGPAGTVEQRIERLNAASDPKSLPISLAPLAENQELIGSANVVASTLTHKQLSPWLSSVVVPAEHREKGVASKLALAAVSEADRLGWNTFDQTAINGVDVCVMESHPLRKAVFAPPEVIF